MDDDVLGIVAGACFIFVIGIIIAVSRYRSRIRIDFEDMHYDADSSLAKAYIYAVLQHQFDEKIRHVEITADIFLDIDRAPTINAPDYSELQYQDILDFWNDLTGQSRKTRNGSSKCTTVIFTTQHGPRRIDSVVGSRDALLGLWLKV